MLEHPYGDGDYLLSTLLSPKLFFMFFRLLISAERSFWMSRSFAWRTRQFWVARLGKERCLMAHLLLVAPRVPSAAMSPASNYIAINN